jgi:hypothetical protein
MPANFSAYSFGFDVAQALQLQTKRAVDAQASALQAYTPAKLTATSPGSQNFRKVPAEPKVAPANGMISGQAASKAAPTPSMLSAFKPARPTMTQMPTPSPNAKKMMTPNPENMIALPSSATPSRAPLSENMPAPAPSRPMPNVNIPDVPVSPLDIQAPDMRSDDRFQVPSLDQVNTDFGPKQRYGFHSSVNNQGFGTTTPRPAASQTIAPTDNPNYQQLTSAYGTQAQPAARPMPQTRPAAGASARALALAGRGVR